jgi:peptidoglycan hydrolase CwlO-like protein
MPPTVSTDPATKADLAETEARLDSKFDKLDARVDKLDARVDKLDAKVDKLDAKVETNFNLLASAILEVKTELGEHRKILGLLQQHAQATAETMAAWVADHRAMKAANDGLAIQHDNLRLEFEHHRDDRGVHQVPRARRTTRRR